VKAPFKYHRRGKWIKTDLRTPLLDFQANLVEGQLPFGFRPVIVRQRHTVMSVADPIHKAERDASTRDVPLVADRKRVVFIGESSTEGTEETFVGRFARAFPELDVLNAAVFSYSPSIYYKKKANIFWTSGLGSTRPSPTSIFPTYEMKLGLISMTSMACCKGRGGVRRKKRGGKRRFMPPTSSMN